jgi:hypothetical protein
MQKDKTYWGYWITTVLLAVWLIGDGLAGVMQVESGKAAFMMLGYPTYLLIINGTAKVIAGIAILQSKYKTLKEWAFAGYVINCIGAGASWWFATQDLVFTFFPLIFLAFTFLNYRLWKKYSARI